VGLPRKTITKILFLGYGDCRLLSFLCERCCVIQTMEKITLKEIKEIDLDVIVSYGYKYILGEEIVNEYKDKILNLHISFLPWNRGMYPNVWSVIDNTPRGITIHLIDKGIDTGDILFQREVEISDEETLFSSYWKLRIEIEELFIENWDLIRNYKFIKNKQSSKGTFHLKEESEKYFEKLGILDFCSFFNWEITLKELRKRNETLKVGD